VAKQVNPRRRRDNDAQRQQAQEEARRRAYRKAVRKRQIIGIGVLTAVVLAVVGTVGLAQSEKAAKPSTTPTSALPTSTTTQLGSNAPPASLPTPAAGVSLTGDTPCPNEDGSSPRTTHFEKAPTGCIDPTREYNATIHTSKGDIVISLLPESSPKSVNNFVSLARYHYYDGLPITRIVPRGWAEIGDPAGPDGKPGPGYRVPGETQPQGSIAAHRGHDP